MRLVHDTAARRDRCLEARLDVLTCDGYVDVHCVAQRLGLVEFLHPHGRAVPKRIDRVVFRHRRVAEDGAPKADVYRIALCRNGELHFLGGRTIGDRTVFQP